MKDFINFATGSPPSIIMITNDESVINIEEFYGLKPGDKVIKIGNYDGGMHFSHRVDQFKSFATYKGTIECDRFFRNENHKFLCFEVLDAIENINRRIFLLYGIYKEGETNLLIIPDVKNNNIRIYDAVFTLI